MSAIPDNETPLEFYTAYLPNGNQKHYLSNDKGGVRLFKDRTILEVWLREKMTPDDFARVVIHPVTANFVIPEPEPESQPEPMPIRTLYPSTQPPTAEDLLADWNKKRKRHKGKRQ